MSGQRNDADNRYPTMARLLDMGLLCFDGGRRVADVCELLISDQRSHLDKTTAIPPPITALIMCATRPNQIASDSIP